MKAPSHHDTYRLSVDISASSSEKANLKAECSGSAPFLNCQVKFHSPPVFLLLHSDYTSRENTQCISVDAASHILISGAASVAKTKLGVSGCYMCYSAQGWIIKRYMELSALVIGDSVYSRI